MPISTNPSFPAPPKDSALWRYSSLPKLLSLLATKRLFMPSLRQLRTDDPFEGAMPATNQALARRLSDEPEFAKTFSKEAFPEMEEAEFENFKPHLIGMLFGNLFSVETKCFASCWHARTRESAALWKLYAETQAGVAISSSVEKLCDSIDTEHELILGSIRYCDFDTDFVQIGNLLHAAFTKRDSYEHEHEVRLLHAHLTEGPPPETVSIPCEPSKLISEVVVSPYSDDWMVSTVQEVVQRLGYEFPVRKSRLMDAAV